MLQKNVNFLLAFQSVSLSFLELSIKCNIIEQEFLKKGYVTVFTQNCLHFEWLDIRL